MVEAQSSPVVLTFVGLMVAGAGSVRVSVWLQAASDGSCSKTSTSEGSNCTIGSHGSFVLGAGDYLSRRTAAHACLLRCTGCAQCRYISVSPRLRDCSWCAATRSLLLTCVRASTQASQTVGCAEFVRAPQVPRVLARQAASGGRRLHLGCSPEEHNVHHTAQAPFGSGQRVSCASQPASGSPEAGGRVEAGPGPNNPNPNPNPNPHPHPNPNRS